MSGSLTAPAVLSAGTPFTDLLRARAPATAGEGEHDSAAPEKNGPAAGLQPAHEQNGLSKADAEGLKRVEPMLSANAGGIRSGEKNPGPLDPPARLEAPAATGPPLGPPSLKRAITRALTMPEGLSTGTPNPVTVPASVLTLSVATQDHDQDTRSATADDTHPGSPTPTISTANHYAFAVYSASEPGKTETATAMAKRTTKNLSVLADATRITESTVEKLELALSQLTVETRLRPDASRTKNLGNRSPSPPPLNHEHGDDIEELFDRVRDLEGQVATAHVFGNAVGARVSSLERRDPAAAPGALTVAELTDLVGRRFGEITSDRDVLDSAIKFNGDRHAEDLRDLRLENKDLRATLAAMQVTITRLQTTVELASPAPLRVRAPSPRRSIAPSSSHARTSRSRSPGRLIPAKRPRVEERKHQDRTREGFVIMGPLSDSPLIPLQLFESLIATNLPAFALTKPYDAVVDPFHPYHIRVTLDSLKTARDLVGAWSVGNRSVGMREFNPQDADLRTGFHDSHSRAPFQESVSQSGYHRRGRDSNNRGARGGFGPQ
ncbi:hypothetical protein B0H15DRAFT_868716 [Mycena belliarum]|uniref:Uncharacterized protein n=1 Tax=Mycena belliarum TaxID=1033014 RepID=A0AAD6TQX4_9AGAR|nr:hypothetical protein B0H15DRAFT_868716 [Mycena belliae]